MNNKWIVVTTINSPTHSIKEIAKLCHKGWSAVVVGDKKTPDDWREDGIDYLSVSAQREHFPGLVDQVPYNHYCRKNLGYLYAIRRGAEVILETDDDNTPYADFGMEIERSVSGRVVNGPGFVNIYAHFTDYSPIWPRGLPLDAIQNPGTLSELADPIACPVQQYLADRDPDVDAVFRLVDKRVSFFDRHADPVVLGKATWTPFNSQNTLFFREAFPLLYLPCFVSFRMTDIWRSFVAQVALAAHHQGVAFLAPTVEQFRNDHDLMVDFKDEIPGYLHNRKIMQVLEVATEAAATRADGDMSKLAILLWKALGDAGFIEDRERGIIEAWHDELRASLRS